MKTVQMTGRISITAAKGDTNPSKVAILAYSGGIMTPMGFGTPVLVDLQGLALPATIPLLADHDSTLTGTVGQGKPQVKGGALFVQGTLSNVPAADQIRQLHRDGVPLQASIGADVVERQFIKPGESIRANGRSHVAGPQGLTYIRASQLKETSIVPIGADSQTSVDITASRAGAKSVEDTIQEVSATQAERQRISSLTKICAGRHPEILERAIDEGWDLVTLKAALYDDGAGSARFSSDEIDRRARELADLRAARPNLSFAAPGERNRGIPKTERRTSSELQVIEASLLIRAGREKLAVATYGEQAAEQARGLRARSMLDIVAAVCAAERIDVSGMGRAEIIATGFSTTSLPVTLSNVMGKSLESAYLEGTQGWRGFAKVLPAADFKPQTAIRPSFVGDLEKLPKAGEIKHGSLAESTYQWSIDTYAKLLTVDRQDIINDDIGFIDQTPSMMGNSAARCVNDLVWRAIMLGEANSFFTVGKGNLGSAALDASGLQSAIAAMKAQRDANNTDLSIMPAILAVPTELEFTARALISSTLLGKTDGSPTGNVLAGMLEVVAESRLSNTAKFSGAATNDWYLFAGPIASPVIVGFLDGRQIPVVESFGPSSESERLALTYRVYLDCGVALGDYRAARKHNV